MPYTMKDGGAEAEPNTDRGAEGDDARHLDDSTENAARDIMAVEHGEVGKAQRNVAPVGTTDDGKATTTDGKAATTDGKAATTDGKGTVHDGKSAPHDGKSAPHDGKAAPAKTKSNEPYNPGTHGKDDVIDVHFDGASWCIEDSSLDKPLQFTHLADAEARASDLSKETGRGVCVHGQDGELISSSDQAK